MVRILYVPRYQDAKKERAVIQGTLSLGALVGWLTIEAKRAKLHIDRRAPWYLINHQLGYLSSREVGSASVAYRAEHVFTVSYFVLTDACQPQWRPRLARRESFR